MGKPVHLLIFGDHASEKLPSIQDLVRQSKSSPNARRFLQEATDVVQLEYSKISNREHGWKGSFDSLLALAEENTGNPNGMLAAVLMCIGRLGKLIVYAENDPSVLGSTEDPVEVIGFCTGLLPAAAVLAARDTSDLLRLAPEIIRVTFRLAYEIWRRMKLVDDPYASWTETYIGLAPDRAQAILDEFHQSQNTPTVRKVAIGIVAQNWLSLFGAPSSLARLRDWSPEIRSLPHLTTYGSGCVHTKYMPKIDAAKVLADSPILQFPIHHDKAKMACPRPSGRYESSTLGDLLGDVVNEIAHEVLSVDRTIECCVSRLDRARTVTIAALGPTSHEAALQKALKTAGIAHEMASCEASVGREGLRGGLDSIAIVGMAGRFPENETVEGFWQDLLAAKCHIKKAPESRFKVDEYYDPSLQEKNSTSAQHGAWIKDPGLFDHKLFNISPREAGQIDPIHRLLLTVSYEALQAAGYSPNRSPSSSTSRIATYFGQLAEDWHDIIHQEGTDIYYVPGIARAFGPSRLNYHYKWGGGSYAVDSACASSMTAIILACEALKARSCDTALAGGGNLMLTPVPFSGLSRSGMLSPTGGCRAFHDDADGYARGEGVGVVVLKRLEDALAENDNILGVIRGAVRMYSTTTTSITHPSHTSQERAYREALRQQCLDPADICYVEMHGTGTQAGDLAEMTSVVNVLARGPKRRQDNPLTVGTVKAAVGHGEGAAGVIALIKTLLMLRHRVIPPQPGWPFTLNRRFPALGPLNVRIATAALPLAPNARGDGKARLLVNALDASGGESCLVVEEPPPAVPRAEDPRSHHVVAVSGRSGFSLQANRQRLLAFLEANPHTPLADLAYTTTARRLHEPLRAAYVGGSTADVAQQLRNACRRGGAAPARPPPACRCVFVFTGQGSQYAGMGARLFHECAAVRELLLGCQDMATAMGLPRFVDVIADASTDLASAGAARTQLAVVALEIAVARALQSWGVVPDVVVGHSLGEYAALCTAGVLSVSDTLFLVGQRALLLETRLQRGTHAMLAAAAGRGELAAAVAEAQLQRSCELACFNAPRSTVVSGPLQDVEALQRRLASRAVKTSLLRVPYGFHSAQVQPIVDEFKAIARAAVFSAPAVPFVSALTGQVERDAVGPDYLARQAREPVNFVGALQAGEAAGLLGRGGAAALWLEIGPDAQCLGLARKTLQLPASRLLPALRRGEDNWRTVSAVLAAAYESNVAVDWPEYHRHCERSLRLVDLPTYAFDYRNFWTPFKEPAKAMAGAPLALSWFPTTSVQAVEQETMADGGQITATFASDSSEPSLLAAIEGHVVDGHVVCPMSILADMALTATKYCHVRLHPARQTPALSVHDISMESAVVLPRAGPKPVICTTAVLRSDHNTASITFHSRHAAGKGKVHGTCKVVLADSAAWVPSFDESAFLIDSRIAALRDQAAAGNAHLARKSIAYKLFAKTAVVYSAGYRGMDEVVFSDASRDAFSTVRLPPNPGPGRFLANPYWVDALTHLGGFLLNATQPSDDASSIFMATGFKSWRFVGDELSPDKTYTTYVSMRDEPGTPFVAGNCYVFDGDRLVQVLSGLRFQKLRKAVLSALLGAAAGSGGANRSVLSPESAGHDISTARGTHASWQPAAARGAPRHNANKAQSTDGSSCFEEEDSGYMSDLTASGGIDHDATAVADILAIVAQESGCGAEDMADEALFVDLGVDSLMAMSILALVAHRTGVDLPPTFFSEHGTVGAARAALLEQLALNARAESEAVADAELRSSCCPAAGRDDDDDDEDNDTNARPSSPHEHQHHDDRRATPPSPLNPPRSLLLQDVPSAHSTACLFLLADETGSATSYIQLPSLGGPHLCVYGIEPALSGTAKSSGAAPQQQQEDLASNSVTLEQLAGSCLAAIRAHQPSGPYLVGGVSSGATLAFEVARLMLAAGEQVRGLLLVEPAATGSQVDERVGLKRLTAAQAAHARRVAAALNAHAMQPLPELPDRAVAILPAGDVDGAMAYWGELLGGGVECRCVDAPAGALLERRNVKLTGQLFLDAMEYFCNGGLLPLRAEPQ